MILVTGGTGRLGAAVVARLGPAGRIASRRTAVGLYTVDYRTGAGFDAALDGVSAIVHCATSFRNEARLAEQVVSAARQNGSPHLVYVSIVGIDQISLGYYRGKLAGERIVQQSGLPYTIQRATQFHDLIRVLLAGLSYSPIMPVPAIPFQPVDADEVADRLADLARSRPIGRAPDIAGPEVLTFPELARIYLRATRRHRLIAPIRLPGHTFAAFRHGRHLNAESTAGQTTFADYLAAQPDQKTLSYRGKS
jgi:uncharacterized protein YbjT (DUF2867 family)